MSIAAPRHRATAVTLPGFRRPRSGLRRYGLAVLLVALALAARFALSPLLGDEAPLLIFVLAVLGAARYGGLGPGLAATALSGLASAFFFLPPRQSLAVAAAADLAALALFGVIGTTISLLNVWLRRVHRRAAHSLEALEESEERFRLLVDGVEDYAIFMLDPEGRVVSWNRGAERIKGYAPPEILGRPYSTFYPPEAQAQGAPEEHLREAVEQGVVRDEGWRVRKDGSRFWASAVLTALRDPAGRLRGFAKVTRDVTQRKQAEEEIRSLAETLEQRVAERTAQLQEANRALEAFGYSISHDLRAPLRGMRGFAQALLEDYGDRLDATGRDYAQRIVAAAARMDRLIHDLLAYSRVSRTDLDLGPVSLAAVVSQAIKDLQESLQARGGEARVEGDLPRVRAHRPTLAQVVANLLANAATFVPPGVAPRILVRAEERDGRVRLWVEDNGIGIAPEHHDRIFQTFERLHGMESYPGTGIGLAIVRKGMERMSGRTGVESAEGAGSRFWIELPRAEEAS